MNAWCSCLPTSWTVTADCTERQSDRRTLMQVGVNYPWRDYGWDFGIPPPLWRDPDASPRWSAEIDGHLLRFRELGISVVRWFLIGDGLTYGAGPDAPRQGPDDAWQFNPPPLAAEFLHHFEELLRRFRLANAAGASATQLLPVLVDFHACNPGILVSEGWVKGGRADALADAHKRQQFFDRALEPLLEVSRRYPDVIYAWELINEPDWITIGWDTTWWRTPPVDESAMRLFLEEGCERVRRAGFSPTVGFALHRTMRASGIVTEINQFHHYPGGRCELGRSPLLDVYPTILGEFATAGSDIWPELPEWDQGVLSRLRTAAAYGYTLAMPWSFLASDRHTAWSADVERDIECFTQQRNRPGSPRPGPPNRE